MLQMSLPVQDKTPWDVLLTALDNAVSHLGLKEVTFKLNVAKSTLCDALKDRNDRRWAQEWTLVVLEMLADSYSETCNQLAKTILDAQAMATRRFEVVAIDDESTPEEIATFERVLARQMKRRRAA